jgi:aminomethyltransferase
VGRIASGGVSPTLDLNIGSAFVELGLDREGVELELDVRGKRQACRVRELPFYSRTRKKQDPPCAPTTASTPRPTSG